MGLFRHLSQLIQEESDKQRKNILSWIGRQREKNNDSLEWWMSHLAGRNNGCSLLFIFLIQIFALRRYILENNNKNSSIMVVCQDSFLLLAVYDNLKEYVDINLPYRWRRGYYIDTISFLRQAIRNLIGQVRRFRNHSYYAKNSRFKKPKPPNGEIYIVHHFIDDQSFEKPNNLSSRYFGILPEWLRGKGKQVYSLPWWLSNLKIPLDEVFHSLRKSNCIIPQDWLKIRHYLLSLFNCLISFRAIKKNIPYSKNFDITKLITRERLFHLGNAISLSEFWVYKYILKSFLKNTNKVTIYNHFEMSPPEHVQTYEIKRISHIKSKSIGYCHTLNSKDYFAYHFPKNESKSRIFPDLVLTNGEINKTMLINQGLSPNRVIAGPAVRQNFPKTESISSVKRDSLLFALSLDPESIIEMIDHILYIADWIQSDLKCSVLIKPHPISSKKSIVEQLGYKSLPEGWDFWDKEIYGALARSRCLVALSSGSIIDAGLSGCIPIALTRELNVNWNCLDSIQDEFSILKPIGKYQLKERLEEIFISNQKHYDIQTSLIRKKLLKGLNPINEDKMEAFLN